ncbi:MAG TPA: hypothetical protein VEN29_20965 [Casimicrobiaceae bacterium]|nr:hypothetical protein [Casimicrobiaceae bacterium]
MATDTTVLGTRWLKFWNYVGLPVATVAAFLASLDLPRFRYENLPIAVLCITVALGLHKKKLWAWQWNWVALALVYVAFLVPVSIRDFDGSFPGFVALGIRTLTSTRWTRDSLGDLALPLALRLILASLIWLWPNWVYWKKRVGLFS